MMNKKRCSMTISREQFDKASAVLAADSRVDAAFLLGSAVHGQMRSDSDIDIAVLPASAIPSGLDRVRLAIKLEQVFNRQVDLGILSHNNLVYAKEAYLNGHRIYCRDAFRCELFGATALGLYADLREARREVEHAYRAG